MGLSSLLSQRRSECVRLSAGSPRSAAPAAPDTFDTPDLPRRARTNKILRRDRIQSILHARNRRTARRGPAPVALRVAFPRDEHSTTRGAVASPFGRATVISSHLCAVDCYGLRSG